MERGGGNNLENTTEVSKNNNNKDDDMNNNNNASSFLLPTSSTAELMTVRRMSQSETWERLKLRRISSSSSSNNVGGTTSRSFDNNNIIDHQKNDDDDNNNANSNNTAASSALLLEEGGRSAATITKNSPPTALSEQLVVQQQQQQLSKRIKSNDTAASTLSSSTYHQIQQQQQQSQIRRPSSSLLKIRSDKNVDKETTNNNNDVVVCIINDSSTIHDAIISQDRINSLLACDDQVLTYEPRQWGFLVKCRGRNLRMITMPLVFLTLWEILWICLLSYVENMADNIRSNIANLSSLISPLLIPVSFLLVFRLGRAAVRFWDARAAIGKIVEICRALFSTAAVALLLNHNNNNMNTTTTTRYQDDDDNNTPSDDECDLLLDDFARWICAFPITVKNFLRPLVRSGWKEDAQETKRRFEFGQLLNEEETDAVLNTDDGNFGTIYVLNRLRELAWKAAAFTCCSSDQNVTTKNTRHQNVPREMLYKQLNEQIDTLTGAWGACERINGTPLPLVYVIHLRTFLILYLMIWEMEAAASHGWVALPIVFAASWGLLGIEAAAVECERPFQWHSNHLALGKMCVVTSNNVAQTFRNIHGTSNRPR